MARINVGDKFPNLTVNTTFQTGTTLHQLCAGKKTVIWVLRYIGCTVCHYDVQIAANRYSELTDKGAQVLFVMQSDQAHLAADYAQGALPFEIVSDPEMKFYEALEIKPADSMDALLGDRKEALMAKGAKAKEMGFVHGDYEGNEQQLPAMFIVAADGTVEYAKYAENIVDLPDFDEVLTLV
ncbi:MAG: redoxin domain-containing protein [Firmicutes bacterium]|nr:redoxin domain-containing protein [Bacillota bacterium]